MFEARGRPINWLPQLSVIGKTFMPIVFRFASIAGVAEKGPLALYTMRVASRGGYLWKHVLFILTCDTVHCTERETSNAI